eukprot:450900_1
MPLSKDGSSFYLIVPNKCKYFLYILVVIIAVIGYQLFKFSGRAPFNRSPDPFTTLEPLSYNFNQNKIILITGANTGIGKETAEILSLTGATVVIGSRSKKRGESAKTDIININKNRTNNVLNIDVMQLDLSSLSKIDTFITNFKSKYNSLDILICNAGIIPQQDGLKTNDGLEAAFGINHIGHMYLVLQLKDLITINQNSRIIMVSAVPYEDAAMSEKFDIGNLNGYTQWDAYMMSKMENIMFTREFAKRYPNNKENNGLYIVSLHPGVGLTDIFRERDEHKDIIIRENTIMISIIRTVLHYFGDTMEQLSYTQLYLALKDIKSLKHGGHYKNDIVQKVYGGVVDNDALCKELWEKSQKIIYDIKSGST